ncbi:hypothetical protein [Novosphingobium pentaromativorans]|uniref:hypothetical protein n=1 Tax=Novosphingobium pentaromativorans TaxID=205844 RepID=UPI000309C29F|nr:hypothetical protein [Novosphingobium pentaromativorans]AIT81261.1 hypothetical protein JI59_16485 [Novosphingobium pentaromativorans US6-1]
MSYEFLGERLLRAVRKPHRCEACGTMIHARQPAVYCSTIQDGDFFGWYSHPECRVAETDWNKRRGPWGNGSWCDEDYCWLFQAVDGEPIEQAWMVANHPIAAGRLRLSIEGCSRAESGHWRWAA